MSLRRGNRLLVRVVVPLSRRPSGRVFRLAGTTLDDEMSASVGPLAIRVPAFGVEATIYPQKPSDFTARSTIARVGRLDRLRALSEASNAGSERWFEDLAAVVGEAPFVATLRALAAPTRPRATDCDADDVATSRTNTRGAAPDDEASHSSVRPRLGPAGAIDDVVRLGRDDTSSLGSKRTARRVRDALGTELHRAAARAIGDTPEERAWRALRWIAALLPKDDSIRVEVVDGTSFERGWAHDEVPADADGPDLVVLAEPLDDADLALAAARAELSLTPLLASTRRADTLEGLVESLAADTRAPFAALRTHDESRWLAVAFNDLVLYEEGAEATRRTLFGSAVWGVLALVIGSQRDTGALGRVLGPAAQQRAPSTWLASIGRDAGMPLPTREFGSIRAQSEAAKFGVVMLGSPRGAETILLSSAPMASASADACHLPAQIWVGKIVRFARWALRSIPADTPDDAIGDLLADAARALLFPGLERAARLGAHVEMIDDGSKRVVVEARMHASVAGEPIALVFPIPRT